MSKEMEEATEAYIIDQTAIVSVLQTKAGHFKAGWEAALRYSPEVRVLLEALEFYANGMAFGHDGKNAIELQRFEGMAHVVYAADMPSMAKPPVKIGTAANEALAAYKKSVGRCRICNVPVGEETEE